MNRLRLEGSDFVAGRARKELTEAQLSKRRRSCVKPNLIEFDFRRSDFGATPGSDGVLATNSIREAGGYNFRRESMRSEFKDSIQIEKL